WDWGPTFPAARTGRPTTARAARPVPAAAAWRRASDPVPSAKGDPAEGAPVPRARPAGLPRPRPESRAARPVPAWEVEAAGRPRPRTVPGRAVVSSRWVARRTATHLRDGPARAPAGALRCGGSDRVSRGAPGELGRPGGGAGADAGPLAQAIDLLAHGGRQGKGLCQCRFDVRLGQLGAVGEGVVERGDHGLLELRAAERLRLPGERVEIEAPRVPVAALEVDLQDVAALLHPGQIDEEDLVEAALAQQLRRQALDAVGGGHHEHRRGLLLEPGEQRSEHARAHPRIVGTRAHP